MPELMNDETRQKLVEVLAEMRGPVSLLLFTEGDPSPASEMQQEILESVVALQTGLIWKSTTPGITLRTSRPTR